MKCKKPFAGVHPCGQCIFCRVNKQREWAYRILLESRLYRHNAFVTLTYKDDSKTSLDPKDLQLFLKKLRRNYEPRTLRFFAVGEYGEQRERPHYHLALFNFPTCSNFRTLHSIQKQCCWSCDLIRKTWGHGIIDVGELNAQTAQYIGGYVTKKMTNIHNEQVREWLKGRHPEFARMSLRPGIGHDFMHEVASTYLQYETAFQAASADVPSALRVGSRSQPLGRYLRRTLRKLVGRDVNAPKEALDENKEMQVLRVDAFNNSQSLKSAVIERYRQKILSTKAREKIRKQRKSL